MRFVTPESNGPAASSGAAEASASFAQKFNAQSSSLPFSQCVPIGTIGGPTYLTAQTLVQHVAYSLSPGLWTYSPEGFDLDAAVQDWFRDKAHNAHGFPTDLYSMQVRQGAGSMALGYHQSRDVEPRTRLMPHTILASTTTLNYLRTALAQSLSPSSKAKSFVAHIAAVDYDGSSSQLVTDYVAAMVLADELGLAMLSSFSAYESQHMSLLATLLADYVPTLHVYDGVGASRETTRIIDVLDQSGLHTNYKSIRREASNQLGGKKDLNRTLLGLFKTFNDEMGTEYGLFEYQGHAAAEFVLVVFGTVESSLASQVAVSLGDHTTKVGVLNVRVCKPFIEPEFLRALPDCVKAIGVLGQVQDHNAATDPGVTSQLYSDVLAATIFSTKWPEVPEIMDIKYARGRKWTPLTIAAAFQILVGKPLLQPSDTEEDPHVLANMKLLDPTSVQQYSIWELDDSPSVQAPLVFGEALSKDSSNNITIRRSHDNLSQGGITKVDIRRSKKIIDAPYSIEEADMIYVGDESILKRFDISKSVKFGGKVMVNLPKVKNEDLEKKLPQSFRASIAKRKVQLYIVDPTISSAVEEDPTLERFVVQIALLRIALPGLEPVGLQKLAAINGTLELLEALSKGLEKSLRLIEVPEDWAADDTSPALLELAPDLEINSFTGHDQTENEPPTYLKDWQTAAKGLAFREAFNTRPSLRPDVAVPTYTVRVKENRRLTPLTYERNIFHIEFDLGTSGLKYDIGEALGIHAENDQFEIEEFIKFYKLDPEEVVEVPSRENPQVLENRTIYQSLMQNVDIFGRPPKRFYEDLAAFADEEKEKHELLALGGPEGANEFKRRAEVDTVTYADILLEFPSAHPSFHDIVRIVSSMKRREYSIASCQKVTPTSVALMIVVVGWVDPKGRDRFGQATRFLNKLKIGAPITVSVKPSVMKLPPNSTQPLIMAGLGTGLAPFRAFVQYRAWEKQQGKEIGSVLLYMGSRHQREEYCYGEEWEAYQDAGVITLLGRAFSRDQPQKIYIQDRMRQTMEEIIQAYLKEDGVFYLCGPTWPVPDVTNVLQEAIATDAKRMGKKIDSRKEIERLKDQLRYVLEVY